MTKPKRSTIASNRRSKAVRRKEATMENIEVIQERLDEIERKIGKLNNWAAMYVQFFGGELEKRSKK